MKRSFATNVDGQIFYMDEDAYNLLQDYLHQLKDTFRGTDGEEIAGDIESRFRELFAEKISGGSSVIVLDDVQKVIERMGRPEDFGGETSYSSTETETVRTETETENAGAAVPPPVGEETKTDRHTFSFSIPSNGKKLYRSTKNRIFGGVLGGLAVYLGWNANILRVLCLALAVFTYFVPFCIAYLIAWMVIPEARTPRQLLEMYGEPVNVGTIGNTVIRESSVTPPPVVDDEPTNGFVSFLRIIANCLAVFFGFIAALILFGLAIAFIVMLVSVGGALFFNFPVLLDSLSLFNRGWASVALVCCAVLLAIILFTALLWGCCVIVFNARKASKSVMITGLVSSMILIVAIVCLGLAIG